jgi:histidine triad (HIT) family protein
MSDCVFCRIAGGSVDHDLTVYEDEHVFVQISLHQKPANRGQVLVITKRHVTNLFDAPSILDAPLLEALRRAAIAVKRTFSADGIQVRQNNGEAAGQDVFHLHFHVIPRFHDDDFDATAYEIVPIRERAAQAEGLRSRINEEA